MDTTKTPENESISKTKKLLTAVKQHKKLIFIIVAAVVIAFVTITILSIIKANKIKPLLENKIFMESPYDDSSISIYAFKDGKIATERWYFPSLEIEGDITAFEHKYRIVASIFSDKIKIQEKLPSLGWVNAVFVYLDDAGLVQSYKFTNLTPDWHETTLESVESLRTVKMCNHTFGKAQVIKKATCSSTGTEKQVCNICGYEKTTTTAKLEHNYVNKVCSICKEKKPAEKANIEANTWYVYKNSVLQIQNCIVSSAFSTSQGEAMLVQYYAVCQHCHVIDESSNLAGPEFGYDVSRIHTCSECKGQTVVRLKLA